jgi:hypothetical protein
MKGSDERNKVHMPEERVKDGHEVPAEGRAWMRRWACWLSFRRSAGTLTERSSGSMVVL